MAKSRKMKEDLGLAEEHIKLAEDLLEGAADECDEDCKKVLTDAAFSLEKAESELEELEE
jgi:hypothetical protein